MSNSCRIHSTIYTEYCFAEEEGVGCLKDPELTSTSLKGGVVSELRGKNTSTKVMVRARKKTGITPNLADRPKHQSQAFLIELFLSCLINLSNRWRVHKTHEEKQFNANNFFKASHWETHAIQYINALFIMHSLFLLEKRTFIFYLKVPNQEL